MNAKFKIVFLIIDISLINCKRGIEYGVDQQKVEKLVKLAEIYGIVKYFQPIDEAFNLGWNTFAIYCTHKILACESQDQFYQKIDSLFKPIMSTLRVDDPMEKGVFSEIFWHHQGVGFGMINEGGPYFSERVVVNEPIMV